MDAAQATPMRHTPDHIKQRMANGVAQCMVVLSNIRKLEAEYNVLAVNKLLEDAQEAAVTREQLRAGC